MEDTKNESVEETTNETVETTVDNTDATEQETTEANAEIEEKEVTPEERLEQLRNFRKNGSVSIDITLEDFKFLRNTFRDKIEWQGPDDAYLLTILNFNLSTAIGQFDEKNKESQNIQLLNSSIEVMYRFQNKIGGKNSHSAKTHLGVFGLINNCVSQLQAIDKEIEKLKAELKPEEKSEKNG